MTTPTDRTLLAFLDRCLEDTLTGKLYLSKTDRETLRRLFARAGRDARRPFRDSRDLLHVYFESLPSHAFLLLYEHLRLFLPDLADLSNRLDAFGDVSLREYLGIQLTVKLHYLFPDPAAIRAWLRANHCERFLSDQHVIEIDDAAEALALDRELTLLIARKLEQEDWN